MQKVATRRFDTQQDCRSWLEVETKNKLEDLFCAVQDEILESEKWKQFVCHDSTPTKQNKIDGWNCFLSHRTYIKHCYQKILFIRHCPHFIDRYIDTTCWYRYYRINKRHLTTQTPYTTMIDNLLLNIFKHFCLLNINTNNILHTGCYKIVGPATHFCIL